MDVHDEMYKLKLGSNAASSVDAYWEYKKIVGDDDGGKMFTPEEYEKYKKKVLPMRLKNRLYTAWSNPAGMDCKMIGPETLCFCQHRYHQHKTDFETLPTTRPIKIPCQVSGCKCSTFLYVPSCGSRPIRCRCKHMATEHEEKNPLKCTNRRCDCSGFHSSFTCGCGEPTYKHSMIVETREEREARGHPVGAVDAPYKAMGGITGFSSLAEGYMRLDTSGQGVPDQEWLDEAITSSDHHLLRSNVASIQAHHDAQARHGQRQARPSIKTSSIESKEVESQTRPHMHESDMDYYERRYQERLALESKSKKDPVGRSGPKTVTTGLRKDTPKSANGRSIARN